MGVTGFRAPIFISSAWHDLENCVYHRGLFLPIQGAIATQLFHMPQWSSDGVVNSSMSLSQMRFFFFLTFLFLTKPSC